MIIPEQLRIGNWVYNPTIRTNMQVYPMMIPQLHRIVSEGGQPNIEPIPITEEILLKCGCIQYSHAPNCFELKTGRQSEIHLFSSDSPVGLANDVPDGMFYTIVNRILVVISSVHQLQNLYFSLTGQELEIKL